MILKYKKMLFLKKLFAPKPALSFSEKKAAFANELLAIEEMYHWFFKKEEMVLAGHLPDHIQNYYSLRQEYEYIRFDYRSGADLPAVIKAACEAAYQKVWGNN